jgi:nucleoside-diphosphate-sugar epimerase
MMKRAIVTGGAGFVGSAVIRELLSNGTEVWAIVRSGFSSRITGSRLEGINVHLVECDLDSISHIPSLIQERGFDVWYQFAWDGLREGLTNYHKQIANIEYVLNSINVASEIGCKKFIGSGSISQFELMMTDGQPLSEDKHRVYKTAKLACEYMGKSVAVENGIEFIWPIITNIYGAGETSPRLINSMIRNLLSGKHQSLSEGNQIYDFIYISDAARAFRLLGEFGHPNKRYVIASGQAQPLKYFLNVVRDIVSPNAELGFGEMSFNGVYLPLQTYSTENLVKDTGFSPYIPFDKGVELTRDWIKQTMK